MEAHLALVKRDKSPDSGDIQKIDHGSRKENYSGKYPAINVFGWIN